MAIIVIDKEYLPKQLQLKTRLEAKYTAIMKHHVTFSQYLKNTICNQMNMPFKTILNVNQ